MDLYDDLGVSPDASQEEIAAAYRQAAKQHHPDAGGDPASFERVRRAALVLRDPAKRERYDRDGIAGDEPDNAMSQAVGILVSAFNQALCGGSLETTDIIERSRRVIQDNLNQIRLGKIQLKAERTKGEKMLERLKHTGSTNFLANHLSDQIAAIDQALQQAEREMEANRKALELSSEYGWSFDAPPEQETFATLRWSPTSNTTIRI